MNPFKLGGGLRNCFSSGGANRLYRLQEPNSRSHERIGCKGSRTPNALAAMNRNVFACSKASEIFLSNKSAAGVDAGTPRSWIGNEMKSNAFRPHEAAFLN